MMKLINQKIVSMLIAVVIMCVGVVGNVSANEQSTAITPAGEIWQGTRDGKPGEGSLFYRLEFGVDDSVLVTKQSGGFNKTETQRWAQQGDVITISSIPGDLITDFDGATIKVLDSEQFRFTLEDDGFNIHKWYQYRAIMHVMFVLFGLMLLNEVCRRNKNLNYLFWFVLPIVLIPLWSSYGVTYWFKWIKLYSVVGAAALFTLIRFTKVGDMKWAKFGAAAFLAINISEAVLQDFSMGNMANILNAIGGVLSIITLTGWAKIAADKSKERDMVWPAMTAFWIIAYDVWNIVFVYLNFPGSATAQMMVLIAATLPAMFIKKGTWLQARAFTLAGSFMYYFSCPFMYESNVVMMPRNDELMLLAGLASFIINAAYAYVFFSGKWKNRRVESPA